MSFSNGAARRRGFTLIELLIVIVILAILALIVIPNVMGASRKAKESTLKANLHEIRNGLEQFQADTGGYPMLLSDLIAPSETALSSTTNILNSDGTTNSGGYVAGTYKGPYLSVNGGGIDGSGLPVNPFVAQNSNTTLQQTDVTANWTYAAVSVNGVNVLQVHPTVPASGNTLDNIPYQSL